MDLAVRDGVNVENLRRLRRSVIALITFALIMTTLTLVIRLYTRIKILKVRGWEDCEASWSNLITVN